LTGVDLEKWSLRFDMLNNPGLFMKLVSFASVFFFFVGIIDINLQK